METVISSMVEMKCQVSVILPINSSGLPAFQAWSYFIQNRLGRIWFNSGCYCVIKLFLEDIWTLIEVLILCLKALHFDPWIFKIWHIFHFCNKVFKFTVFELKSSWQKVGKIKKCLSILIYFIFFAIWEFFFLFFFEVFVDYTSRCFSPKNVVK